MLEKIEDEYDTILAEKSYEEYLASGEKSRPIEEFWAELEDEGLI